MNEETIKKMALVIAANCLLPSKNQEFPLEKEQFNKQVSDRLYTFLLYLLNKSSIEYSSLMTELAKNYPEDWPLPELDSSFVQIVNNSAHQMNDGVNL